MPDTIEQAIQDQKNVPYGSIDQVGGKKTAYITGTTAPMEDAAYGEYAKFQQGQIKPLELYDQFEEMAGLPQLRKTASSLRGAIGNAEDALRRAEPDTAARSRNSLVTDAQRRGIVASVQKPIQENLSYLGTALGRVQEGITAGEANIGTKTGLVMQGQQIDRDTYKLKFDMLTDRAARLESGFSEDREIEYNFLMDKIQRMRQLTDQEYNRLVELQKMKVANDYSLQQIRAQGENSMNLARFTASVPQVTTGAGYLVNPLSGSATKFGSSSGGINFGGSGSRYY